MALIECPDCKNMISENATACIHCGAPVEKANGGGESKLILYADRYPRFKLRNFTYGIYNEAGVKIANVYLGSCVVIPIEKETKIYAKFNGGILQLFSKEKAKSNVVTVQPGKVTKLNIKLEVVKHGIGFWRPIIIE